MSAPSFSRGPRGSTLLEVLAAGAVLLIGMTGITSLLIAGLAAHREVNVALRAMNYSSSVASQYESVDYAGLTAGVLDSGVQFDEDNRRYPVVTTISAVGDGGVGAWRVEVHSTWINALQQPVDAVAVTIVSQVPDANF
jgi:Tfp pilus assembly protein PilV